MDKEENKKSEASLREEKILEFWRENKIFEKSLEKSAPKGEFIFYEGPPTANGKPGIHHLLPRAFKDAIPRYKTMRGYHVRRKGGWDTHGLPVELQVEKKLGLNSKKAIEEYGIAKFNQECKESVWEYLDVWNKFTKRIGFWVDQENPYVTYQNDYIESVWNIVKKVDDRNLLYKDYKVVPWCPRCGTALSSHELAQGYEDVKDLSVYVKFKVKSGQKIGNWEVVGNTYILAWTTTPWTLPGNIALAIGKDIDYVKIKVKDEIFILAKMRLSIMSESYEILEEFKGKNLVGFEYEPLFPFLSNTIPPSEKSKLEKAYKVYEADFVNTEDGTGIVHTSVMYGQDDFELGTKVGLPKHHIVNSEGSFIKNTGFLEGRFVKEVDQNGKPTLAVDIIEDLKKRNLFFKQENYKHSYPHCWRCHTALIYYARDSWYIRMSDSKIKKELISENKTINWEPAYTRDGRFGEWLREIKDWAISRERYWGTPLPVWVSGNGDKIVVDSVETLKKYTKKSNNKYIMMRHGGALRNRDGFVDSGLRPDNVLTDLGIKQVNESLNDIKNKKIDLIIFSPVLRAKQTAEIVKQYLGLPDSAFISDSRLREIAFGVYESRPIKDYWRAFPNAEDRFNIAPEGGESIQSLKNRVGGFLDDIETKYQNKNILIVAHEDTMWMLHAAALGHNKTEAIKLKSSHQDVFKNAEVHNLDFAPLPKNENYELDLHRPYIDNVAFEKDGENYFRAKEVMDVWFDSGAMPFAQDHYPFENKKWVDGAGYPADYISEAIDQTRGWFYTLHAVGALMGRGKAYKNVICLGHLLDANGKKMSKSLGNVVEPFEAIGRYGVDTLRLWMYSVNQPGESKNFDEKTVTLLQQQVFGLLYNVLAFYELYRDKNLEENAKSKSKNILDVWLLEKLDELIEFSTKNLDSYKLLEPTRALRDFIGDLSTWYLRRSRERIKEGEKDAKRTLYYVLKTLAKLMAPFAPFTAEDIWIKLRNENDRESVHLTEWPKMSKSLFDIFGSNKSKVLENMDIVRNIVKRGLEARQRYKIQVRQPLAKLETKNYKLSNEYKSLIKDELNIEEIIETEQTDDNVLLFTTITPELKAKGEYRELARALQDMRRKMGLTPSDVVMLIFETDDAGRKLIQKFEIDIKKVVLASKIEFRNNNGDEIKIDKLIFKIKIEK